MVAVRGRRVGERTSCWQDRTLSVDMSLLEYQLLLRLRMLSEGVHIFRVGKEQKGQVGLREFRLVKISNPVLRARENQEGNHDQTVDG